MVARTIPYKSGDKPPPNERLPSITDEMQKRAEAGQSNIKKQLEHAQQQIDLTKGNLEQYSLSAISALAERVVAALVPR
jgi:hypothetical protein